MNPTSGLPVVGYVSLSKKRDSEPQFPHLCMEQNDMPSAYLIGWIIGCENASASAVPSVCCNFSFMLN